MFQEKLFPAATRTATARNKHKLSSYGYCLCASEIKQFNWWCLRSGSRITESGHPMCTFFQKASKNCHICDQLESPFCFLSHLCRNFKDILLIELVLNSRQTFISTQQHRFIENFVIFMSVEITIFAGFSLSVTNLKAMLIFAAQSSFSKIWTSFSLTRLGSSFESWKLNTLWRPFSISVSVNTCWQAINSFRSCSLSYSFLMFFFQISNRITRFPRLKPVNFLAILLIWMIAWKLLLKRYTLSWL